MRIKFHDICQDVVKLMLALRFLPSDKNNMFSTYTNFQWPFKKWTLKTTIADRGQQPFVLKNDLPSLLLLPQQKMAQSWWGCSTACCVWFRHYFLTNFNISRIFCHCLWAYLGALKINRFYYNILTKLIYEYIHNSHITFLKWFVKKKNNI